MNTKTCYLCGIEHALVYFSTLPRWVRPVELTDISCTYCYWLQMMTHRAEYHIDGIIYVPREDTNENKSIMETVAKYLPVWLKNEKAQKRYLVLGELREQVQQFHQFRKDFASGMIYKRPFKIGEFPPGATTELIGAMNHAQP